MDARALLALQVGWGAGAALAALPVDRFAALDARSGETGAARSQPRPPMAPHPGRTAGAGTSSPDTLDGLRADILAWDCALRSTVTNVVLPQGPWDARVVVIGEVPDGDADAAGLPYAGAAGAMLDAWLATVGLHRPSLLVSPCLPWRPPGARPPTAAEEASGRPFVRRLLTLSPALDILVLGPAAGRIAVDAPPKMGSTVEIGDKRLWLMPGTTDVARRPAQKRIVWAVLRKLRRTLDEISA